MTADWLPVQFLGGAFEGARARHIDEQTYVTHIGFLAPFTSGRLRRERGMLLCRPKVPEERLTDFYRETGVDGPVTCPRCLDLAAKHEIDPGEAS